jgi:hypothetical protein
MGGGSRSSTPGLPQQQPSGPSTGVFIPRVDTQVRSAAQRSGSCTRAPPACLDGDCPSSWRGGGRRHLCLCHRRPPPATLPQLAPCPHRRPQPLLLPDTPRRATPSALGCSSCSSSRAACWARGRTCRPCRAAHRPRTCGRSCSSCSRRRPRPWAQRISRGRSRRRGRGRGRGRTAPAPALGCVRSRSSSRCLPAPAVPASLAWWPVLVW